MPAGVDVGAVVAFELMDLAVQALASLRVQMKFFWTLPTKRIV